MEQYALSNYKTASLAFERVLYFGDGQYALQSLDHLASIRLQQKDIEGAINYYHQASVRANEYNEKSWFTLRKCAGLLTLKKTQIALIDLYDLNDNLPDSSLHYKYFLLGIAHFSTLDFSESRSAFIKAIPENQIKKIAQIDSLFKVLVRIKNPKPKTAKILSMILPGSGQFYAGDIKNGINSLLLTGGFLYLGIHSALNYGIINSLASASPWIQRYYLGGFKRAELIAEEKLALKRDRIYQQVLDVFESN
jgi:tetratricopeptide (TPR) repeat protein